MFNGIVKHTGKINAIFKKNKDCRIEILKNEIGSSVSCSGSCLTLEKIKGNLSVFYLSTETLNKTNFKIANKEDIINLEKSLKYGDRISGHLVQGHVDVTSTVKNINFVENKSKKECCCIDSQQ